MNSLAGSENSFFGCQAGRDNVSGVQNAYFGLGPGGIAAVRLNDGEKKWFKALAPAAAVATHPGQDGPLTAAPGIVFSGGWDGVVRALSTKTVVCSGNTTQFAIFKPSTE